LVSLAHFKTDCINLIKPVSFGFSRPLNSLFFMTAMNSLLLSCPSTKNVSSSCVIFETKKLTVFIEDGENDVNDVITEVDVSYGLGDVFKSGLVDRSPGYVVKSQSGIHVVDVI
jgi:hypothetical protein